MKPTSTVERITPTIAAQILEGNTHNRQFSSAISMRYAREMTEGRWLLNGEPIIIAANGVLLDGQHRLYAVLEAEKAQDFFVVRGVEADAFATIDTGAMRRAKDVLSVEKTANPLVAGAVCKMVLQYQSNPNLFATRITFSNQEILDFYHANKEAIDAAASMGARQRLKSILASTVSGFLMAIVSSELRERVEQFFLSLESGAGLESTSPIYVLRERLRRERDGAARVRTEIKTALTIKAWNAWVTGRTMSKISFAQDKEGFPVPIVTARQLTKALGGKAA